MAQIQYNDNPAGARPSSIDWRDYASILLERVWVALTVLVLCVAGAMVHLRRQIPTYVSSARIMVEDRPSIALNLQEVLSGNRNSVEAYNTHIQALYSRKMILAALRRPELADSRDFLPAGLPEDAQVDLARQYLRVAPVQQSRMIDIVVEHPKPDLAATFANAVADQYMLQEQEIRMSRSTESMEWYRQQAETYRKKLEEGLLALQKYRQEQNAISLEQDQNVVVATLKARSTSLSEAENSRRLLEAARTVVQAAAGDGEKLAAIPQIAADSAVLSARTALEKKRNEATVLAGRYGPKHPDMVAATAESLVLEQAYKSALQTAAIQVEAQYQTALAQESTLRQALKDQEKEAFELDRKLVRYQQLKRGVEADQQIYDGMLARMKETTLVQDTGMNYIRLVDSARPSKHPARPDPRRIITTGILLGILLGIGAAFGAHAADNRLRRVDEVERDLGHPVLASIPHIPGKNGQERSQISSRKPGSIPSEAFRTLRACVGLQPRGRDARTLLVTSVGVSDGKSLVASNLAIMFAQDNRKTLLIDVDMRRPTVHRTFAVDEAHKATGLSSVLGKAVPWEKAVLKSDLPGLDILPAGPIPENPAELLGSAAMVALIADLSKHYERIILDSPPAIGVSDPLVLLPRVDGIIFVVHFGKTRRFAAKVAVQQLESSGTPVIGTVVNNVQAGRAGSYYNYYYTRHGGYHYHEGGGG